MNNKLFLILLVTILALVIAGCEDRTELTAPAAPQPNLGNIDFTRYVAIGNSLTAGFQSGALYASAQEYSYGNLIAQQVGANYAQPLVSDPGLGSKMYISSLDPFVLSFSSSQGAATNLEYPAPYNNLGVPGALLYDVLNATNSTNCASALFANSPNQLFDLILRNQALNLGSQFQQAKALNPTFVTCWIGNNDVLGFATSGGAAPTAPTPQEQFAGLYSMLADSLASLNADVVLANIPPVTSIPFFTTVGPQVALAGVPWGLIQGIYYQKHGEGVASSNIDSLGLLTGKILFTLRGSSYASLIGTSTGQWYRDLAASNNVPVSAVMPAGIDTTQPFGLHPQNPWPDALTLDEDEIATAGNAITAYNTTIAGLANQHGFGLVDINAVLASLRQSDFTGGTMIDGVTFSTMFVTGGVFSLDGVHPTDRGQAIIANAFIQAINGKFNVSIPLINVSTVPGSLEFAKINLNKRIFPYFVNGCFKNLNLYL